MTLVELESTTISYLNRWIAVKISKIEIRVTLNNDKYIFSLKYIHTLLKLPCNTYSIDGSYQSSNLLRYFIEHHTIIYTHQRPDPIARHPLRHVKSQ